MQVKLAPKASFLTALKVWICAGHGEGIGELERVWARLRQGWIGYGLGMERHGQGIERLESASGYGQGMGRVLKRWKVHHGMGKNWAWHKSSGKSMVVARHRQVMGRA